MQNPTPQPNQALAARLEAARRELLDLGLRNSLLNYRSTGARSIEVVDELPVQIFRLLVREKKALTFLGDSAKDRARAARNPNQPSLFESIPPLEQPAAREPFRPDGAPANPESTSAGPGEAPVLAPTPPPAADAATGSQFRFPQPGSNESEPEKPLYSFPQPGKASPELPTAFGQPLPPQEEAPIMPGTPASLESPSPDLDKAELEKRYTDSKLQTALATEDLQKRLLKIFYDARASIEDQGVNILYLALGMLEWYESDSSEMVRKAPLLLIPVEIVRSNVKERFKLRYTEEDLGHNLSLENKLKAEFGLNLPHLPEPEELEIEPYFSEVEEGVSGLKRWRVDRRAISLGFFSFAKQVLYKDLDLDSWPDGQGPLQHPILNGLFMGGLVEPANPIPEDAPLDRYLAPADLNLVMDADSSQVMAVTDVRQGRNLVIHGPPGTGKSQTITNLIAEALGQDKTVLFVAEKMAALEVVKRRLDNLGLGEACLELHSHKAKKKEVLDELARTLNLARPTLDSFEQELTLLTTNRSRLNDFADAMNTPVRESRKTPFQIMGELIRLEREHARQSLPRLAFDGTREWSWAEYIRLKAIIEELAGLFRAIGSPRHHSFWGSRRETLGVREPQELADRLKDALAAIDRVRSGTGRVTTLLNLPAPERPWEFRLSPLLQAAPPLYGLNLAASAWVEQTAAIQQLLQLGPQLNALYARYQGQVRPEAYTTNLSPVREALEKFGPKFWRGFAGPYKQAKATLASLLSGPLPAETAQLALVNDLIQAQQLRAEWDKRQGLGEFLFRRDWQGLNSDWPKLTAQATFATELHRRIAAEEGPASLPAFLASQPNLTPLKQNLAEMDQAIANHVRAIRQVLGLLELDETARFGTAGPLLLQPYAEQLKVLRDWQAHLTGWPEIVSYNDLVGRGEAAGLKAYVQAADSWPEAGLYLEPTFEKNWLEALLDVAYRERKPLNLFQRESHEQVINQFRRLDKQILVHNRAKLTLLNARKVSQVWQTADKPWTVQLRVLKREMEKKTRHIAIRKLLKTAGPVIQNIKPVFMMSPLSVAAYLTPGELKFDLVIFDEASQVRPADAFGAILRGNQLVVAGDDRQLPPTSFFERLTQDDTLAEDEDEYDEELAASNASGDFESILKLFKSVSKPRLLRWHYRSRHESLIAVSNSEFYENKLIIFPSPDQGRLEYGLVYHHLPQAVYDRSKSRTNLLEARTVAQAVMDHARQRPDLTLGVGTFSMAQREAITEQLEMLRRADGSCEGFFTAHPDEPFFIKNLENIQGDERDVIYISLGYGRDSAGKVTLNFGPLTAKGGERRLNVLISRARQRCEVFTNLTEDDIDLTRTESEGVRALKTFLKYARTGSLEAGPEASGRPAGSPFEEEVRLALEAKGYRVAGQVGQAGFFIDLAVIDPDQPGRYLLGIECDGATYHSALSARDRDRLRQQILEGLGWKIHRIWSTDWFHNPAREIERVEAAIQAARTAPATG
jgi:very-short-patch-repair endonuclease/DNA polymerase III delta prime subunit